MTSESQQEAQHGGAIKTVIKPDQKHRLLLWNVHCIGVWSASSCAILHLDKVWSANVAHIPCLQAVVKAPQLINVYTSSHSSYNGRVQSLLTGVIALITQAAALLGPEATNHQNGDPNLLIVTLGRQYLQNLIRKLVATPLKPIAHKPDCPSLWMGWMQCFVNAPHVIQAEECTGVNMDNRTSDQVRQTHFSSVQPVRYHAQMTACNLCLVIG